ncbi:hypothetical protein IKF04_03840 [Candidatus Saccharibacteria bacterium]|nr:hypothetical protein [Candidatus Saccharibacteria bacterium]
MIYNCQGKADACKANDIGIFVDDSPKNCIEVQAELGIPVIGFESVITANGLREANISSVKTWNELKEAFARIMAARTTTSID